MSSSKLLYFGACTSDLYLGHWVTIDRRDEQLQFQDTRTGRSVVVPVQALPRPGGKVTALKPVRAEGFKGMISKMELGGGGLRQVLELARIARVDPHHADVNAFYLDSGPPNERCSSLCKDRGVNTQSLGLHKELVNLVFNLGNDKAIVRSPVVPIQTGWPHDDGRQCKLIAKLTRAADTICVVSPKAASVVRGLFGSMSGGAAHFLQPTGSLQPHQTRWLLRRSDLFACNWTELQRLVADLGQETDDLDEASNQLPERVAELAGWLSMGGHFAGQAAAITRGAHGVVVIDFYRGEVTNIAIRHLGKTVPTQNGAGDRWAAAWIYYRQIAGLDALGAARKATHYTALGHGLQPRQFELRLEPLAFPAAVSR